jgi:hypothetical protein
MKTLTHGYALAVGRLQGEGDNMGTPAGRRQISEAAAVYRVRPLQTPEVVIHPSAQRRAELPEVQAILPSLFETLTQAADEYGIPVSRFRLRVPWSPEEEMELVIEQWVKAPTAEANDYWDTLDPVLQDWADGLPDDLGRYVDDHTLVGVRWDSDGLPF